MKEFIEKLIGRLEELNQTQIKKYTECLCKGNLACIYDKTDIEDAKVKTTYEIIQIANQLAEEYNDGWISVSDRFPESGVSVIVSYKDRFLSQADGTCEGWYDATNMIWHLTDYEYSDNVEVIAWRERLTPYQPEGE